MLIHAAPLWKGQRRLHLIASMLISIHASHHTHPIILTLSFYPPTQSSTCSPPRSLWPHPECQRRAGRSWGLWPWRSAWRAPWMCPGPIVAPWCLCWGTALQTSWLSVIVDTRHQYSKQYHNIQDWHVDTQVQLVGQMYTLVLDFNWYFNRLDFVWNFLTQYWY